MKRSMFGLAVLLTAGLYGTLPLSVNAQSLPGDTNDNSKGKRPDDSPTNPTPGSAGSGQTTTEGGLETKTDPNHNRTKNGSKTTTGTTQGLLSPTEFNFTQDFANADRAEMLAAKMAVQKAFSDPLRQYAQRTIDDYSVSDAHLQAALAARGLVEPARLDAKNTSRLTILSKLSDVEFDREYRQFITSSGTQMISLLQGEIKNGKDTNLKSYAKTTLAAAQAHLKLARTIIKSGSTPVSTGTATRSSR